MQCFVICAIGGIGTPIRRRADNIYNHIVKPAVGDIIPVRADLLDSPGVITNQVVELLLESELVIADLTGGNPNVYYELALRHISRKPCIQLIEEGEALPFDIANMRTVQVNSRDLESANRCREDLEKQIATVLASGYIPESPISSSIDLLEFRNSHNPMDRAAAEMLALIGEIRLELHAIGADQRKDNSGDGPLTEEEEDEFLVLRRAVREASKEGSISAYGLRRLQELVQFDSPGLASWLGVLASRRATDELRCLDRQIMTKTQFLAQPSVLAILPIGAPFG